MAGEIFLIGSDDVMVVLSETPYDDEAFLQSLLERYPNVLAGDSGDTANRRWVLVRREIGVAAEEGGAARFSLDHLFLDQDAVPTLVEVKRSSDTRIRREVVGQMLDYAANAVSYWPIENLRTSFEETCALSSTDPAQALEVLLGADADPEEFWASVEANLRSGRVRLVFVADALPVELRRVIEFLNEQMSPAEVIGIEVRQYVGGDSRALVPHVVGQTAQAEQSRRKSSVWDEQRFLDELRVSATPEEARVAEQLMEWSSVHLPNVKWGSGQTFGSFNPYVTLGRVTYRPIGIYTDGPSLNVRVDLLKDKPPFTDEKRQQELRQRLHDNHFNVSEEKWLTDWPTVNLREFVDADALSRLVDMLTWLIDEIRASHVELPAVLAMNGGPAQ